MVSLQPVRRGSTKSRLYSHDIRGTLTATALDGLQLSSKLGAQDFEDESVRVLVDERPIKVEHDELFSRVARGHGERCACQFFRISIEEVVVVYCLRYKLGSLA